MADEPEDEYATIAVTHHAALRERARGERQRMPAEGLPCAEAGHVWVVDRAREGWLICLSCSGVKSG